MPRRCSSASSRDKLLTLRGVYGFWPANTVGEDIVLSDPDSRIPIPWGCFASTCCGSRKRSATASRIDRWPTSSRPIESGIVDYLGAFAVTAGIGASDLVARYEADHDDYHAIMVKALADRLAEAFAEYLHARARKDWGYGAARAADQRRPGARAISRHPARLWLPRMPRSQREDRSCSRCLAPSGPACR